MKPKRHYINSNLNYILAGLLLLPLLYAIVFLSFETAIYISVALLPLLFVPSLINSYVEVKKESIYKFSVQGKYTLSGKPMKDKGYSLSININNIAKIEKIRKNKNLCGLLIYVDYHVEPTKIMTKTASQLLQEILSVEPDIVVT